MLQPNSDWPEPNANLFVRVVDQEKTDAHTFTYRSDGLLSIENAMDAPEIVKNAAGQEQTLINSTEMQALRRLIDRIDAQVTS